MKIAGVTALVTGANRGLGRAYAQALLARGASRVYGGARNPATVTDEGVLPVELDITDPAQVARAAEQCGDVTLLINNAGILSGDARAEMEVNYFGTMAVSRAFAPRLADGALVNVLSVLSWISLPNAGTYAASKSAAWNLTNSLRAELRAQGTLVVGVHAAFIDTDMAARVNAPKISPDEVVAQTLDAIEAGREEVLADQLTRDVKAGLAG
ncbi:SDR family oxidoreductase [Nonomuraea sp. NPDC050556]|uniref:SDR family oxidoreductase n=1 Tax=Nonomuraea sp. NPDC050556 TaxID=3364369 RepID=UPI00378F143B